MKLTDLMHKKNGAGKTYHIAFSGVFDIANYGDHLFPELFTFWMNSNGIDVRLDLFSPLECN